uniref:Uncharacterized protein n=1 Tax=Romanomermis culicivorax TaxID=13658 RepID=A0A915JFY7_ROMCU
MARYWNDDEEATNYDNYDKDYDKDKCWRCSELISKDRPNGDGAVGFSIGAKNLCSLLYNRSYK